MLNVATPQVVLNGPGVMPFIGQLVPTGMAQHVRVNRERKPGRGASPGHYLAHRGGRQGAFALGDKDIGRIRVAPL